MNCERHAASTELCLTIARLKSVCDSPLKNPSYALNPVDFFADHSIRKKKLKRKKRRRNNREKNATDTNQQLYQKNYHRGLKDKCSETRKRKNEEKHDTKKTYK